MPISEIIDRYTITKLKTERTDEDVSNELNSYREEIDKYKINVEEYIDRMYDINGTLWNYETQMRKLMDSKNATGPIVDANELPLEEIGKLALLVRDLNGTRNGLKSEIVEKFSEGFKDIKINYVKTDYPVLSNLGLKFEDGN
tara:strand:+ start:1130 stop:1558 length:429 start_codon:yes stop_codon:yes gene_type:complete